jgi:hypothetical protein
MNSGEIDNRRDDPDVLFRTSREWDRIRKAQKAMQPLCQWCLDVRIADDIDGAGRTSVENWQFELGQVVTRKDRPMPATVMSRTRTAIGRELYGVRLIDEQDERPDRTVLGEALIAA